MSGWFEKGKDNQNQKVQLLKQLMLQEILKHDEFLPQIAEILLPAHIVDWDFNVFKILKLLRK